MPMSPEIALKLFNFVLLLAAYGWYVWAVSGFFKKIVDKDPVGLKVLKIANLVTMTLTTGAVLTSPPAPLWAGIVASVTILFALRLFRSSLQANAKRPLSLAFSPDSPKHLMSDGPYQWVRHPFYLAYLLTYFAGTLAAFRIGLIPLPLMMVWVYFNAAQKEEAKFASSALAAAHAEYRRHTGMFIPRLFT